MIPFPAGHVRRAAGAQIADLKFLVGIRSPFVHLYYNVVCWRLPAIRQIQFIMPDDNIWFRGDSDRAVGYRHIRAALSLADFASISYYSFRLGKVRQQQPQARYTDRRPNYRDMEHQFNPKQHHILLGFQVRVSSLLLLVG